MTRKTKIHKVTILVVDHDDLGADDVADVIRNAHYPNHCISPTIVETQTVESEWADDHPLNRWRDKDDLRQKVATLFDVPEPALSTGDEVVIVATPDIGWDDRWGRVGDRSFVSRIDADTTHGDGITVYIDGGDVSGGPWAYAPENLKVLK